MKLAVLGSGDKAIAVATHFHNLGAQLCLFSNKRTLKEKVAFEVIDHSVKRVQKRFLKKSDSQTRLQDLFRIVYEQRPEAQPKDISANLDQSIVNSLEESIESFSDFDLVIDAFDDFDFPLPMGAAGTYALNEHKLCDHSKIEYGFYENSQASGSNRVLVGDNEEALKILLSQSDNILEGVVKIHLITSEDKPFMRVGESELKLKYKKLMKDLVSSFEDKSSGFQTQINLWKEDQSRAKPIEPTFPILFYTSFHVTSVDQLIDQESLFLTIERPSFCEKGEDLRTISADFIYVANGFERNDFYKISLRQQESGFYCLNQMQDIPVIEKDVLSFFSKVQ